MKAHLTKVSLALLSTVFLLGCQEQGSGPLGPEGPQFDKKGTGDCEDKPHTVHCHVDDGDTGGDNPGSPFYAYTFADDITTDPSPAGGTDGNQHGIYLHSSCVIDPEVCVGFPQEELDLSRLLVGVVSAAEKCFDDGIFPGPEWNGRLLTSNQVVNEVQAHFLLTAFDKIDTENQITYRLTLDGNLTPDGNAETTANQEAGDGIFPPEVGETMTVTFTTFSIGPQRNKEKKACSHTGDVGTLTTVQITGTDADPNPER